MKKELTQHNITQFLDWLFEKAVAGIGVPGYGPAMELAEQYLKGDGCLPEKVDMLISFQNKKAATSGFVTGLGGVFTLPFTVPIDLSNIAFIQLRMIAAIAYMGGYDLKDDKVQTLAYVCLCGNAGKEILKDIGIKFGEEFSKKVIRNISGATIAKINQAVGFRLLTKSGTSAVINLGKCLPVVSGIIGGSFDLVMTNQVGKTAKSTFINQELEEGKDSELMVMSRNIKPN